MTLEEQDRTRWDPRHIAEALPLVEEALRGGPGPFSVQAAIAALHCQAACPEDTDWRQIVRLYDVLERLQPSPVVSRNRAVAVAMVDGPDAALALIERLAANGDLDDDYHLLHADLDLPKVMDEIWGTISFGVGRKNDERVRDAAVFDTIAESPAAEQRELLSLAKEQLGTVGSGNHYVDLLEDRADGRLWLGVHFGSRGFGYKTASGFLALANGRKWGDRVNDNMDAPPAVIRLGTPLADDYLAAMDVAGQYAYAGRDWVVNRVLKMLGAGDEFRVHNHHNFAWWEEHDGERWLVVRKGATPAFPGQLGFVGGSMGDAAVIVRGKESAQSRQALYSTVHGAGRVMGRMEAKGKWKGGTCVRPGKINWPAWQTTLRAQGVELRGGGADEAPQCYKRLADVLAYHGDTIDALHTLHPVGVAMAGHDTFDPYRD